MKVTYDNVLIERADINSNTNLLLNKHNDDFGRIILINNNDLFKKGDLIAFKNNNVVIIHIDDKEYLIIKEQDILLIL